MKITFFGTQPYDRESFDRANERYGFEFNYHRSHLNGNNTSLAQGADAVCIFVNDTADAATIRSLAANTYIRRPSGQKISKAIRARPITGA